MPAEDLSKNKNFIEDQVGELEVRAGKFLPYQWQFVFDPAEFTICASGFGSGKTHSGIYKGLILSQVFPKNRGLVGRFHGSDLDDSVIPLFHELCPPSWIRNYNKQKNIVTLKNHSQILFRHIHDASASGVKSRRVGANLGWFFVDQLEECQEAHWNTLVGRLRLPAARKRFGFATMNPNGHDWLYRRFFRGIGRLPTDKHVAVRNGTELGIAVVSEVNRKSRGGFVDDSYFDNMRKTYPTEWIRRWLECSFDDFSGKIYKEYDYESVHNLSPFPIPSYWPHLIGIDVGGDAPWAIVDAVCDDYSNIIAIKEFYKPSVNVAEVAHWIKNNTPWNDPKTVFVIDWENKLAMLELQQDHGIVCRPAIKKVHPGLLRVGGYLHVERDNEFPQWFRDTQPTDRIAKFNPRGAPRMFVFAEQCPNFCREFDGYVWDPNKPSKPLKQEDHICDAVRYLTFNRPDAAELPKVDKYRKLRGTDPQAAREWEQFDKRCEARKMVNSGQLMTEMDGDSPREREEDQAMEVLTGRKGYEFDVSE